ncbi:MAG: hypothetical protein ACRYG5_04820 [Janthinobacterium lividum]
MPEIKFDSPTRRRAIGRLLNAAATPWIGKAVVSTGFLAAAARSMGQTSQNPVNAELQVPAGPPQWLRVRWPDTTLPPRDAGTLVELADRDGKRLKFTFMVAPEDLGHGERPLWLVFRDAGQPAFTLRVGQGLGQGYVRSWSDLVDDSSLTLASLPVAGVEASAWGAIGAIVEDAETSQQASLRTWRTSGIGVAVVALVILGAVVRRLARTQPRSSDDVSKL